MNGRTHRAGTLLLHPRTGNRAQPTRERDGGEDERRHQPGPETEHLHRCDAADAVVAEADAEWQADDPEGDEHDDHRAERHLVAAQGTERDHLRRIGELPDGGEQHEANGDLAHRRVGRVRGDDQLARGQNERYRNTGNDQPHRHAGPCDEARGRRIAAAEFLADADRQREITIANAYRDAQKLKGEGDAEAARIYAEAFGKDPQFAQFYRSLEAYKGSFNKKSDVMVLDPSSSDFFKVFRGSVPASAPAAPRK